MRFINYSISEILKKKNEGENTAELLVLYEEVEKYKNAMETGVAEDIRKIHELKPDNVMRWIQENVDADIRQYVCCAMLGKDVNVLMRSERKWKTVSDLGLEVEEQGSLAANIEGWFNEWKEQARQVASIHEKVYETHAHYNLKNYNGFRGELMELMHDSGIEDIVIPAVDYETNQQMMDFFDKPEYAYVRYAFGAHPKYLWKEKWDLARWDEYRRMLQHPKCVAVGEAGLDYSYTGFCEEHRQLQISMFRQFVDIANEYNLPLVLHIRPSEDMCLSQYDVDEDALSVLKARKIKYGAVLHCFGGSLSDVEKYMEVGVSAFGIGGRITYNNSQLEEAVAKMPEEAIVLETDAPYIKLDSSHLPNTSLALGDIASKIAQIRNTSPQHIMKITRDNAIRLYRG